MEKFDDKAVGEVVNRVVVFAKRLPPGITLSGAIVTASVWEKSTTPDPNPALFNQPPLVNTNAFVTDKGVTVLPGQAIIQQISGGVVGATYVLSFQATTSASPPEKLFEDVRQTVSEYVPPR